MFSNRRGSQTVLSASIRTELQALETSLNFSLHTETLVLSLRNVERQAGVDVRWGKVGRPPRQQKIITHCRVIRMGQFKNLEVFAKMARQGEALHTNDGAVK